LGAFSTADKYCLWGTVEKRDAHKPSTTTNLMFYTDTLKPAQSIIWLFEEDLLSVYIGEALMFTECIKH
jgi:hypothetical protein